MSKRNPASTFKDNKIGFLAITDYYELYRFSPVSWSSIDRIDIEELTQMPSITYIYIAFAVLIIGLILSAILINRKQSINVLPPI